MGVREVTESGVLWLREELVVRNLEWLGTSPVKNVLEVVLEDHTRSELRFTALVLHCHKEFLNKL